MKLTVTLDQEKTMDNNSSGVINALITIDTDKVLRDHPTPSQNPDAPTLTTEGCAYMVVSGAATNVKGQGTYNLEFTAVSGDVLRGFAVSGSNNFEDAVLLYGFSPIYGDKPVTGTFTYDDIDRESVVGGTPAPLPGKMVPKTKFWFFQGNAKHEGTTRYNARFALYTRVGGKLVLKGYYSWDPTIVVQG